MKKNLKSGEILESRKGVGDTDTQSHLLSTLLLRMLHLSLPRQHSSFLNTRPIVTVPRPIPAMKGKWVIHPHPTALRSEPFSKDFSLSCRVGGNESGREVGI
jgi:hypothetical protein